ncbi:MAG: bifunctional phosphopantothenoylcysteine decarboxylase/phosphopantothenate--cysteine ligase CoaBC [Gammaproteobacteria bacterium]|nr:bifunctional phosphopantothenoylcysteine decarboxylase/phosphopantothenate--cysteine ligase CoaBC [Gammaproteobacteria bacterium]
MNALVNKHILLGVSGGIAAYKSADLVRRLREAGAEVRVVMTRAATEFITPLTLQALSGHAVRLDIFDPQAEAAMGHIELARWADAVLVAPASADFMARLTHGRGDDLLSTLCLATTAPIALAPAMNQQMWLNAATQANKEVLEQRGIRLFGPATGSQACGETGPGRMLEPADIVPQVVGLFQTNVLSGLRVLVSAGPTRELIDPVRYISNRSSGKMGYALAEAATEAGAEVTLVSGPVMLAVPERVRCIDVQSAREMHAAVLAQAPSHAIFIAAAAVADYHVADSVPQKIKKTQEVLALSLVRNPDILGDVAAMPNAPFTVGFAAETENLELNAQAKRAQKKLDLIAANLVSRPDIGFDSDDNELKLFWEGGTRELARATKTRLARTLISIIAEQYHAKNPA